MGAIAIHGKLSVFDAAGRKTDFGALTTPAMRKAWERDVEEAKRPNMFLAKLLAGDRNRFWTATGRLSPKNGRLRVVCRYIGP